MSELHHKLPGVSAAGLIAERDLAKRAQGRTVEQFLARYPVPALVFVALCSGRIRLKERSSSSPDQTTSGKWGGGMKYSGRIAFLAKRPGNPFETRVTLGRAPNNDIVIDLPTVSKFHAFFEKDGDRWALIALASVNGTYVNGDVLVANTRHHLAPGDVVRVGAEVEGVLTPPAALHARVSGRLGGA